MAQTVNFYIKAGLPFERMLVVDLPPNRDWWLTLADFEVRSQIREGDSNKTKLVLDLTPYLTVVMIDSNTVQIDLVMTGAATRLIPKPGKFDMLMTDSGIVDVRGAKLLKGSVYLESVITSAAEETP